MPIETAMAASAAEISSSASRYVSVSRPMPSYSSGVIIPRKPSLPISSITSRGKWLVRSHSAAKGAIFSAANSRASSTTSRCSVAVSIEPLPRFPSQLTRSHHLFQERRGTVLLFVEPVLKDLHDRQADVETDQVGERERADRMIHSQFHHLIDAFGRRDPFLDAEDRLVDHRHQHAIRDEAGRVLHLDGRLAELFGKR